MPPRLGTLDVASVAPEVPHLSSLASPTWDLPGAHFLQINWEVEDPGALELTPPLFTHPSRRSSLCSVGTSPSHRSGLSLWSRCDWWYEPASGRAAFASAWLWIPPPPPTPCRTHWGYPVQLGEVEAARRHDHVRFTAALDGRTVIDLAVHTVDVINGGDLMTFDNLHLVQLEDQQGVKLVQIDPEYTIQEADRGRPSVSLPDSRALGMQGRIQLTTPIIGFTFRADTDLVPVRFVIDSVQPASASTSRVR